jgi:hypothetical protein
VAGKMNTELMLEKLLEFMTLVQDGSSGKFETVGVRIGGRLITDEKFIKVVDEAMFMVG